MPAKASRAAFGEALVDLGAKDDRIVTVDADLSKSTMTAKFAKTYPGRAFNVGIAESGMIGLAAGLALAGRVPFACSFACFVVGRFETIRVSVAYSNAPVILVGTHVGVAIGEDGYTQMGLEDMACLRSLPNIPIIQPADEIETKQVVAYAVEHRKPLDEEALLLSAGKTGRVVTVEDHSIHGGLGGAVSELLSEVMPTPVKRLGVVGFGESGDAKGLYAKHGLDPDGIAKSVLKFLNR